MHVIIILGAIISLSTSLYYTYCIIRGQVKPNRVTWLIWAIAPLISAGATFSTGVTWSVLPVFMAGFGPTIVFIVSLLNKESYWAISRFDYICGVVSILALIAWYLTKEPNVAIILSILSDFLAAFPTVVKTWRYPDTESSLAYFGSIFSAASTFSEVHHLRLTEVAFPLYLMLLNLTLLLIIEGRRRYFLKKR